MNETRTPVMVHPPTKKDLVRVRDKLTRDGRLVPSPKGQISFGQVIDYLIQRFDEEDA